MILKGFILSIENFGENDLNLIFFSEEKGKIKILVRGARKPKAKLRGLCQFFVFLKLSLVQGKKEFHLIGGEEIKTFKNIFKSFHKLKETYFILKTLDNFSPFLKKEPKIFALSLKTLEKINSLSQEKIDLLKGAFLIKFLAFSGWKPVLDKCLICQNHFLGPKEKIFFNFKEGGAICAHCFKKEMPVDQVSKEDLVFLKNLLFKDFDFLAKIKITPQIKKAKKIIEEFLKWRI